MTESNGTERAINHSFQHFWHELRRRRVLHAVGLYLAGCWVLLQVFDIAAPEVGMPPWTMALLVWAVILLLPVATAISWFYDITPDGIMRTPPAASRKGQDLSLHLRDYLVIVVLIVFVIAMVASLAGLLRSDAPPLVDRAVPDHSIAVLPFANLGDRTENEHLATGLPEDILHRLAAVEGLQVASRTAAFELDRRDLNIGQIGQRLGVRYVLEGSVRRQDKRLRIVAQLIDTVEGFHVTSLSYDREMRDLFGIYDEIAGAVAEELQLTLAPESRRAAVPTEDIQAYDYFLQARSMLETGKQDYGAYLRSQASEERVAQANSQFEQAGDLLSASVGAESAANAARFFASASDQDPEFAAAWAGQCQALMDWHYYQPDARKLERAEASCRRALALDPDLVAGRVALGDLYRKTGWTERAIDEYRAALRGDRNRADAWLGLGEALAVLEDDEAAERAMHTAITLDPDDLRAYYTLGAFLFHHGRYADAASVYRQLARHPAAGAGAHEGLGTAYFMLGEFGQAAEAYRRVIELSPTARAYSNVGTQYYYNGQFEDAVVMYRQAVALGPTHPVWWGNLGDALRATDGGWETALDAYGKAAELAAELLRVNPDEAGNLTNLGHFHARLGNDVEAMRYLERARAVAPHDIYVEYYAALAHLEAGRQEDALEAIRRSLERGYPVTLLRKDPQFAALGRNDAFRSLIAESAGARGY
ncbi:MAG: tetratricopeptide repeat protein [Xanthomonadales bacterium]|nr:tetratricopeptide repeat protein [Xanthomonadales bacterium]